MSFVDEILERLRARAEAVALYEVQAEALVPTSGAALLELVQRARAFLRGAGVSPGERVALLGPKHRNVLDHQRVKTVRDALIVERAQGRLTEIGEGEARNAERRRATVLVARRRLWSEAK